MIVPECMLASSYKDGLDLSKHVMVQRKEDGIRAIISKQNGEIKILGRTSQHTKKRSDFTDRLPELVEVFQKVPHDFILDGELISTDFVILQTKIRTTTKYIEDPNLMYIAFDHINDLPCRDRYNVAFQIVQNLKSPMVGISETVTRYVPFEPNDKRFYKKLINEAVRLGIEGYIIKDPNSLYEPNKRSKGWIKLTPHKEFDVEVVDKIIGEGKYSQVLGALTCQIIGTGKRFNLGSGFTDEQRSKIWNMETLPPIVKVKYKDFYASGLPRMPIFMNFKED